jgi:Ca2+-transporting ATPase
VTPLAGFPHDDKAPLALRIDPVDRDVILAVDAGGSSRILRLGIRGAMVVRSSDLADVAGSVTDIVLALEIGRHHDAVVVDDAEGRGIYDNIRKTLQYLLAGNAGELLLMAACIVGGLPLSLLPIHLLWINLVTDGLPALCLATDPIDRDVMRRPPRGREAGIADREFVRTLVLTAVLTAGVAMGVFLYGLSFESEEMARTHAFAALVFAELFRSFSARSETRRVWELDWSSNLKLLAVVALTFSFQIASHHVEPLQSFLQTSPLQWSECIAIVFVATIPCLVLELRKTMALRRRPAV